MHIYEGTQIGSNMMKICRGTWTGVDLIQPGRLRPDVEDWREAVPTETGIVYRFRTFQVRFVNGIAEVDEAIGNFMIQQGNATAKPARGGSEPVPALPLSLPTSDFDQIPGADRMRVYGGGARGSGTIICQPGRDCPDVPGWVETERRIFGDDETTYKSYPQFVVRFEGGVAEVAIELGRYLVREGLATAWPRASVDPALAQPAA